MVFTLPHALIAQNRAALYRLLFRPASATLVQFERQRLAARVGLTAVLSGSTQRGVSTVPAVRPHTIRMLAHRQPSGYTSLR